MRLPSYLRLVLLNSEVFPLKLAQPAVNASTLSSHPQIKCASSTAIQANRLQNALDVFPPMVTVRKREPVSRRLSGDARMIENSPLSMPFHMLQSSLTAATVNATAMIPQAARERC